MIANEGAPEFDPTAVWRDDRDASLTIIPSCNDSTLYQIEISNPFATEMFIFHLIVDCKCYMYMCISLSSLIVGLLVIGSCPAIKSHPKNQDWQLVKKVILNIQWNLSKVVNFGPEIYTPLSRHLIVWTAQIGFVACSLLKFGLDESKRREPKGCCLPVRWLVCSTYHNYHLVAR